jgi:hypothetical protein
MRILIATDAWHPQVNGVVRTYERLGQEVERQGFQLSFLGPPSFRTLPCPTYPEIRLSVAFPKTVAHHIEAARPDFIHIATEGPIGLMTRNYCRKRKRPFTTSYHTRFPEYISARIPVPKRWCYELQRRFHSGAAGTFVATRGTRLRAADGMVARGRYRAVPPARYSPVRRGAGVPLCRPHLGGKEPGGLP